MHPPPLHAIVRALTAAGDRPLPLPTTDVVAYSAQDFWVYVGDRLGPLASGLTYVPDLLVRGASPDAADGMLKQDAPTSQTERVSLTAWYETPCSLSSSPTPATGGEAGSSSP